MGFWKATSNDWEIHAPGPAGPNCDAATIQHFGEEWKRFDQLGLSDAELREMFEEYFGIWPWHVLPSAAVGFDLGCGSGRWGKYVAPRVGALHCIDASKEALDVARQTLAGLPNCVFHLASADSIPLEDSSADFGYCLGVLHHLPDSAGGLKACVAKLKDRAPFLLYLYYALEFRPGWFRCLWRITDRVRRVTCRLPFSARCLVSEAIAAVIYYPLARLSLCLERVGVDVGGAPLSAFRRRSFYTMRTDALDRFGTPIEKRFTRTEVFDMMTSAGLEDITFADARTGPYWCAVGYKKPLGRVV